MECLDGVRAQTGGKAVWSWLCLGGIYCFDAAACRKPPPPLLQVTARDGSPSGGCLEPQGVRVMASPPFCLDIFINSDLITLRCAGIIKPSNNVLLSL